LIFYTASSNTPSIVDYLGAHLFFSFVSDLRKGLPLSQGEQAIGLWVVVHSGTPRIFTSRKTPRLGSEWEK
jgi:hypothetical protein